jgi:hypothetical protein
VGSDTNEGVCLGRAKDIWTYCQNSAQQKVKATFLNTGNSATYPEGGIGIHIRIKRLSFKLHTMPIDIS